MPKNNGKARKAQRKALADYNKRYRDKYGEAPCYPPLRDERPDSYNPAIDLLRSIFEEN